MGKAEVKQFMQMVVRKINSNDELMKTVLDWIGPHYGKILMVELEDGTMHLIITKKGMKIVEGTYPSPDVIYQADSKVFLGIFTGKLPFRDAMKNGSLWVIGAAHESVPLAKLMFDAMMGR